VPAPVAGVFGLVGPPADGSDRPRHDHGRDLFDALGDAFLRADVHLSRGHVGVPCRDARQVQECDGRCAEANQALGPRLFVGRATIYVLDKKSVIRFNGVRGPELEAAVEQLMKEE
jgi:hypothetical protein